MARSCGIRLGPRRFEFVVLDGSPKKHRITAFKVSEFPQDAEDPLAGAIAALKEAAKQHSVPHENVAIAVDTGMGAFRTLKLPFSDREKINEVIKFELESELPQWNIDDVVVDFLPVEKTDRETTLLVTAVPKWQLERAIDLATRAGLEPLECELEATAMVNAALSADVCHADDAQILVHVGELSTSVVVVDAGHVRSIRAIHIGALSHEPAQAEEEGAEASAKVADAPPPEPASEEERARRLEHAVSRIRRELGRTISGGRTANPIDSIFVCGMDLPGLIGSAILDVPVYELDVFEEQGGQPAEGTAPLVVAYGVALRQLGGGLIPASLRREELRYTGAFEKIELPLAVAALLMVTWLSVFCIFELNQVQARELDVDLWRRSSNNYMLGVPAAGIPGALEVPPESVTNYIEGVRKRSQKPGMTADKNPEIDPDRSRLEQMRNTFRLLKIEVDTLSKALGHTGEVTAPQSALEALTRAVAVLVELKDQVGRHSIRSVKSAFQPGNVSKPDSVRLTLDMTFFADSATRATENLESFTRALQAKPWVISVDSRGSKSIEEGLVVDGGMGIFVDGLEILCDLSKVEHKQPEAPAEAGQ